MSLLNNLSTVDCDVLSPVLGYSDTTPYVTFGFLCIIPILTLFGNALVILSYVKFRFLRTKCHIFILSLAIADICVCLLVMPLRLYVVITNEEWYLGHVFCDIVNILDVVLSTTSILNLAGLAFERYLVICHHFVYRRLNKNQVVVFVLLCWIFPILIFVLPMSLKWHIIGIEDFSMCISTSPPRCPLLFNIPFGILATSISFHIPFIFMVVCYWRIFLAAKRHAEVFRNFSIILLRDSQIKETTAARTLGIVMGCFCICWLPFSIICTVGHLSNNSISFPLLHFIALWLGYANSCMNPLLYYVFSRDFKIAYKAIFHCQNTKSKPNIQLYLVNLKKLNIQEQRVRPTPITS